MAKMNYDHLLKHIGELGRFQKWSIFGAVLIQCNTAIGILMTVFMLAVPHYRCAVPGLPNDTYHAQSPAHQTLIDAFIPRDSSTPDGLSQCEVFTEGFNESSFLSDLLSDSYNIDSNSNSTERKKEKCERWVYSLGDVDSTLIEELDMVCEDAIKTTNTKMIAMFGMFVGSLFSGFLSDRFGRKPVMLIPQIFVTVIGIATALVHDYTSLLAVRFLMITMLYLSLISAFTWVVEIVSVRHRSTAGIIYSMGWAFGMAVLALAAFLIRDWRTLQLVVSVPSCLFCGLHWFLPESPRWLICKGRYKDAQKAVEWIARVNQKEAPPTSLMTSEQPVDGASSGMMKSGNEMDTFIVDDNDGRAPSGSIFMIFKSRVLAVRFSILSFNWIVVAMVYYGLSLNMGVLMEGSLHLNFTIACVLETVAYTAVLILAEKVGRKTLYCPLILGVASACLGTLVPVLTESDQEWINTVLVLLGQGGLSVCLAVLYIITTEILPTLVRNSGLGVASFLGRIGSIVSPFIGNLHYVVPGPLGKGLPLLVFGSLAVLAGLLALMLPETRHKPLPDTLEQAQALGRRRKRDNTHKPAC